MPTIQERLEERDPQDLRVLTRHTLGFVDLGGDTCVVIELSARNPVTGATETTSYVASLAGAVTLTADLTGIVESDAGILALVRSTLADARSMKAAAERAAAAARCTLGPDECMDCADVVAEAEMFRRQTVAPEEG